MSGIDDMLKTIGIAAIGIFAIGVVLCFLSAMCLLVAVFTYTSIPEVPTVTIGPVEAPITAIENNALFDQVKAIPKGHYEFYSVILSPGMAINVSVATNDTPVDIMVMDSANYGKYVTAINNLSGGNWRDYVSEKSVELKNFRFVANATDRYYVIIDNTRSPAGGAYAGKDASVHTTITSQ